jgi:hypothetical protein
MAIWDSWITRKSGIFSARNGGRNDDTNHERMKSVTRTILEHRHIIKFLHLKGLTLGDSAVELSSLYSQNAHTRSSIKYWLHQVSLGRKDLTTKHVGGRPPLDDTDTEIRSVLRKSPFSWVRTIADTLGTPAFKVYWHLVEKIGFKNYFLLWVPHTLTEELR